MPSLPARRLAVVVALAISALAAAPASTAGPTVSPNDALESAVVARINTIRESRGLAAVTLRSRLETAGTKHATNMAMKGYFSHDWSTGAAFGTWIQWYWPGPGYGTWSAGENLYWRSGDATARGVVAAWMQSAGHRANILRASWRGIGVGAIRVESPVGVYRGWPRVTIVAAEFGRRS